MTKVSYPPRQSSFWPIWQLWATLFVLMFGGLGFGATSWLLKIPALTNCSQVIWPLASASPNNFKAPKTLSKEQ